MLKYTGSDVFRSTNRFAPRNGDRDSLGTGSGPSPEELANDLEAMGPTFVKIGQILSSRPDLIPAPYMRALSRLQDRVKPFSFAEVEKIIERELGVRISKAFAEFDAEPLAAASLGQVHRATLRDGRDVVVKVQRPGIREQIGRDFEVIEEIVELLQQHTKLARRYQFEKVLEEFEHTLEHELDYQREAGNLRVIAENLKDFPHIRIPQPIADYTTHAVLTMEYVEGRKITKLTPLARLDLDGAALAEELFKAYLKQVLVDGFFHADPHPGNVYLTDDKEIALLDLGMVGRLAPGMQDKLIRLLLSIADGRSEEAATIAIEISETAERFDETAFRRHIGLLIAEQKGNRLSEIEVGSTVLEVCRSAAESGLFAPTELTMLGKTLLQLDQVGRTLHPTFDPNDAIRRNVSDILQQRVKSQFTSASMYSSALEVKEFLSALPNRLSRIFDSIAAPQLELKIRPRDRHLILQGISHTANRITAGLILAAMIVGAALLMRVPTDFTLWGYPGLAMIFFLLAALGGGILLFNIFTQDAKEKRRAREN
ncbi:MAG TPA: AarF/UbiB family protein [Candidatus Acidoferrum sp.]|nr:AarF/UbiB family protein [Candidatus Acidoferrum sp.]